MLLMSFRLNITIAEWESESQFCVDKTSINEGHFNIKYESLWLNNPNDSNLTGKIF